MTHWHDTQVSFTVGSETPRPYSVNVVILLGGYNRSRGWNLLLNRPESSKHNRKAPLTANRKYLKICILTL